MTRDEDFIESLEVEHLGLSAKIIQLLKWGAAIMFELNECMARSMDLEGQMGVLTEQKASSNLAKHEKKYIEEILSQCNGNKSQAARVLGIDRRALLRRADKHGLSKEVPTKDRKKQAKQESGLQLLQSVKK